MSGPEFAGVTVGPDDFLVLVPRGTATSSELLQLSSGIPKALRERVIITSDLDAYVVQPKERP